MCHWDDTCIWINAKCYLKNIYWLFPNKKLQFSFLRYCSENRLSTRELHSQELVIVVRDLKIMINKQCCCFACKVYLINIICKLYKIIQLNICSLKYTIFRFSFSYVVEQACKPWLMLNSKKVNVGFKFKMYSTPLNILFICTIEKLLKNIEYLKNTLLIL